MGGSRSLKNGFLSSVLALFASGAAHAQGSITVTTFTGPWEIAERECFIDPFVKQTGAKVIIEPGVSSVTLMKLRQGKGSAGVDVAWMNGGDSERAWDEGLLDPIDPTKMSNIKNLSDRAVYKIGEQIYALSTGYFALTLLYNTELIDVPPDSWWSLWDSKYAGKVFSLGPAGSLFTPMMMHLNGVLGGSNSDFSPIVDKFSTLKAAIYYSSSGSLQPAIQSGEVVLGAYYSNTAWTLIDEGVPVAVANPKEGLPAADQRLHLVKNSPNKVLAEQFIDYSLSETALNCIAEKMYVGPPLITPTLSARAKERMPWGLNGSIEDLYIPDWNEVNSIRQSVTNLWNRRVVQ
ncbi:MAG: ABC transporter substrate-binding protein [Burkholderiaceae bacterium]|nr:ABC transporter substrate-binding protein [Burkholderiaceae bacterium]